MDDTFAVDGYAYNDTRMSPHCAYQTTCNGTTGVHTYGMCVYLLSASNVCAGPM